MNDVNDMDAIQLHRLLYYMVRASDVDSINKVYKEIDFDNITMLKLIILLRSTAVFKRQIPCWTRVVILAYEMCKEMSIQPRKELWGLI